MTTRTAGLALVVLAVALVATLLALVSSATGAATAVSARATLTGSGTSFRMTIVNEGDRPILCFGLLLDGVQPTSATGPAGVLTRVGTFQGRGLVHLQGTAAAPVVPPGGTITVDFRTNVPIAPNAGGEIRYSDTCQPGSDQTGRASGPPPPPQPKPKPQPKPCQCKDLRTRIVPNRLLTPENTSTGMRLELLVEWSLTCTKGRGKCKGVLTLVPSVHAKRLGASVAAPAGGNVTCSGPCARKTTRFQRYVVTTGPRYGEGKRGRTEKLLRLEMKRVCKSTRVRQIFDIAFTKSGAVDKRRSDLT